MNRADVRLQALLVADRPSRRLAAPAPLPCPRCDAPAVQTSRGSWCPECSAPVRVRA